MPYDSKCYELAEYFLEDVGVPVVPKETVEKLAQTIQEAVEDFLDNIEHDHEMEALRDRETDRKIDERLLEEG
jgi:hypothetical protein